jgi:hypothetical protein
MSRRGYRNLMFFCLIFQLTLAGIIFSKAQDLETEISNAENNLVAVQQERDNMARLSAALAELDQLTINETDLTQLDILKYLDLAQTNITVTMKGAEEQQLGGGSLKVRTIGLDGTMPYPAAMNFIDRFHNNRKLIIRSITMKVDDKDRQNIAFSVEGTLYGLTKATVGVAPVSSSVPTPAENAAL